MTSINIKGRTFGRLIVLSPAGVLSNGSDARDGLKAWLCRCGCGNKKVIRGRDLRTGNTRSCGCLRNEETYKRSFRHGMYGTRLYRIWAGIKKRCSKKNKGKNKEIYANVKICKEWSNFNNFFNWAKNKYIKGLDIDRENTFEGYSPSNCRFVTRKENTQNSKKAKWWYVNGEKFGSSGDAARHLGVRQSTIFSWCMGKKSGKYKYPRKEKCYTINKYNGGQKCH